MQKTIFGFFGIATVSAGLLLAQGPRMGGGMRGNQPSGPGAIAGSMWGGGLGAPGMAAENRVARLALFLDLNESQKAAALKIFEAVHANAEQHQQESLELRDRWQAAIANGDLGQIDSLALEWAKLMATQRTAAARAQIEFRALLTAEQLKKLDALNGAGWGLMGQRGNGFGMRGGNCAQFQNQP